MHGSWRHYSTCTTESGIFTIENMISCESFESSRVIGLDGKSEIDCSVRKSMSFIFSSKCGNAINLEMASLFRTISMDFNVTIDNPLTWKCNVYHEGDFFLPHRDSSGPTDFSERLLTLVIGLSDVSEVQGGGLELMGVSGSPWGKCNLLFRINRRDALVFESFMLHQVTPINFGYRKSLVAFIPGRKNGNLQ